LGGAERGVANEGPEVGLGGPAVEPRLYLAVERDSIESGIEAWLSRAPSRLNQLGIRAQSLERSCYYGASVRAKVECPGSKCHAVGCPPSLEHRCERRAS